MLHEREYYRADKTHYDMLEALYGKKHTLFEQETYLLILHLATNETLSLLTCYKVIIRKIPRRSLSLLLKYKKEIYYI